MFKDQHYPALPGLSWRTSWVIWSNLTKHAADRPKYHTHPLQQSLCLLCLNFNLNLDVHWHKRPHLSLINKYEQRKPVAYAGGRRLEACRRFAAGLQHPEENQWGEQRTDWMNEHGLVHKAHQLGGTDLSQDQLDRKETLVTSIDFVSASIMSKHKSKKNK